MLMHSLGVVQAQRTSWNLLEPQPHRDSKVCRRLSHEFGVVRPYRTISMYIVTGVQGAYALVQGGSSTSNHFITEIARCGEF